MAKKTSAPKLEQFPMPMFKTIELMSKISGIGENKLRELIDRNEIEYLPNGNRRLLADEALWDWYRRNKVSVGEVQ